MSKFQKLTGRCINTDAAAPIEDGIEAADADMDCNPYLCKGYQYDDNVENVHNFTSGQVVPFFVDIVAAHKPGWAVSKIPPTQLTYIQRCSV